MQINKNLAKLKYKISVNLKENISALVSSLTYSILYRIEADEIEAAMKAKLSE